MTTKERVARRFLQGGLILESDARRRAQEWLAAQDKIPEWYLSAKDKIPGGLGDKKKPSDFDPKQIEKGVKVEMEHTDDKSLAREIAMDHLTEDPKYYDKLETIEKHGNRHVVRAAMDAAKLEQWMLKIRKSQGHPTIGWKPLIEVLQALNPRWKLEPIVGLIKMYGTNERPDTAESVFGRTEEEVLEAHKKHQKDAVNSLPSSPKAGQLYILDLTDIQENRHGKYFQLKPWLGHEGWKLTSPEGRTFEALPSQFSVSGNLLHGYRPLKRSKLPVRDTLDWLNKETDWVTQINKQLQMDPHEKAEPRTRENTGTCPVCFNNIKVQKGEMVIHGYKRPGTGQTHGRCFGVGYPPFELKVTGTKDYLLEVIEPSIVSVKDYLKRLKDGLIDSIQMRQGTYTPDHPMWDRAVKAITQDKQSQLKGLEAQQDAYKKLVSKWKKRPLPKEGEPHIDWYHKGQR